MTILSLCEPKISVNTPFSKFLRCREMKDHGPDLVETFANLHRVSLSPTQRSNIQDLGKLVLGIVDMISKYFVVYQKMRLDFFLEQIGLY